MTTGAMLALTGATLAIAIVPGPSDVLVVAQSITAGSSHGAAVAAATVTIAIVKLGYAYLSGRAKTLIETGRARSVMHVIGGGVLAGTGVFLLLRA